MKVRIRMLKRDMGQNPGKVLRVVDTVAQMLVGRGSAEYVESKAGVKAAPVSNKRKAG